MSSKRRHRSHSSYNDSSSFDSYSDSSSHSDYHSKRKRKHKRKKSKSKRHKHKSKPKKDKKSKRKHNKLRSHKRHRTHNNSDSNSDTIAAKHKKRKLTKDNPCANQEMITNAKTVLNITCDNNPKIKQFLTDLFTKLDNNESISIHSPQNIQYSQPLQMIFTFLSLHTTDNVTYSKSDTNPSLLSVFKSELKTDTNDTQTFIGPSLPSKPSNAIIETETSVSNADIIGVTMPTNNDLLNNTYSSEGSDDGYGPALNEGMSNKTENKRKMQMLHTKIYSEMSHKINNNGVNDSEDKREEWMKIMPDSIMADFDKGTKQRGFRNSQHSIDQSWMDTPEDIMRRKAEVRRVRHIHSETDQKLKGMGLPSVEGYEKGLRQESMAGMNEDKGMGSGARERKKSLFEMHTEKLKEEYERELREWKRDKKKGKCVGARPVYKGAKEFDGNGKYDGSMDRYYTPNNPVFMRGKLGKFVDGGTIEDY